MIVDWDLFRTYRYYLAENTDDFLSAFPAEWWFFIALGVFLTLCWHCVVYRADD